MISDRGSPASESLSFSGSSRYLDTHPTSQGTQPRIYVRFRPDGEAYPRVALLDTGAHFCILEQALVGRISDRLTESIGPFEMQTVYGLIKGELYIHRITLLAEVGESLDVEMTLFISPDWPGSNFLGYMGAMDRVRFAIDPQRNRFYVASSS